MNSLFKQISFSILMMLLFSVLPVQAELKSHEVSGYVSTHELVLPGSPEMIYDAMTGEIGGWWDHKFTENPISFRIEPKPGGGFWEIFDESGDGVLHGTVIYAQRGKRLTFRGPLGFNGTALDLVATYSYEAANDSTKLTVTVNYDGQVSPEEAKLIDQVWYHFMFEGLKPWIESGKHLKQ